MKSVSLNDFSERLTAVMPVLCKSMMQYEQNALTSGEVSIPEFWSLSWLLEHKDATMHDLSQAMNMKASTATMLVDRLVQMKLIERKRDEADRRKVMVRTTAKGKRLVEEVHAQKKNALQKTFRHLSPDERQQYLKLIEKLAGRLQGIQSS